MKKFNLNRYKAIRGAKQFMDEHESALNSIPLFAHEKAAFVSVFDLLEDAILIHSSNLKSFTHVKIKDKAAMANIVTRFAMRAAVQAGQLGNTQLKGALGKSRSYIFKSRDNLAIERAMQLKNLMNDNLAILTELTEADIAAMAGAIAKFEHAHAQRPYEIKQRKATGTDLIPGLLKQADHIKANITCLIHSYLPDLARAWDYRIRVGKPTGTRHQSLVIKYIDADSKAPVKNVKCTAMDGIKSKVKTSTKYGWVRFSSLQSGNYTLRSEHKLYAPDTQTKLPIHYRKILRLRIKLRKKE